MARERLGAEELPLTEPSALRVSRLPGHDDPHDAEDEVGDADHGGTVMVEGNTITDNGTGIFVNGASDTGFVDNHVCENETNVLLAVGAEAPDPAVNEICEDDAA